VSFMANLDFYGLKNDLLSLLSFIYDETDIIIFESYSEFDAELRSFTSLFELQSAFEIGDAQKGQILLQLYSPSVMKMPKPRRIKSKIKEFSCRYSIEGVGLIQLYLGGLRDNVITESHYGHWSRAGAEQRSVLPTNDCDWASLIKISGRLQRFIRGFAVAKVNSRIILPEAMSEIKSGKRLQFFNQVLDIASQNLVPLRKGI
jgi:hypothetical protein